MGAQDPGALVRERVGELRGSGGHAARRPRSLGERYGPESGGAADQQGERSQERRQAGRTRRIPKRTSKLSPNNSASAPKIWTRPSRAWGAKTTDPYDAGLAALYERNYSKATADLQDSLKQREEKLASDQKAVADAAFFLGESLYGKASTRNRLVAYQRCLQIRPDDTWLLNLTRSPKLAGDYAGAVLLCGGLWRSGESAGTG